MATTAPIGEYVQQQLFDPTPYMTQPDHHYTDVAVEDSDVHEVLEKVVVEKEYDSDGRLVKETRTVLAPKKERRVAPSIPYQPYQPISPQPSNPWAPVPNVYPNQWYSHSSNINDFQRTVDNNNHTF